MIYRISCYNPQGSLSCISQVVVDLFCTTVLPSHTMTVQLLHNNKTYILNTSAKIPAIGLGTWKSKGEKDGYNSVLSALKAGYRHIDTAAKYDNEIQVGKAIRDSGITRDEIFVTTKLWCTQHREVEKALDESLERLGLDYVDLYLMHWPVSLKQDTIQDGNLMVIPLLPDGSRDVDLEDWNFVKTWELMQKLPKNKVRAIGVSNFSINNIKDLLNSPGNTTAPALNQIELHPFLPQFETVEWCLKNGIQIEAYSPLGSSGAPLLSDPLIIELAEKHNVRPGHIVISWHVQRGYIVLPKSVNEARIASNLLTITLPEEDMNMINNLSKLRGEMRLSKPDWGKFTPFV